MNGILTLILALLLPWATSSLALYAWMKRRSGFAREKAYIEGFAAKPAPTVHSRLTQAGSIVTGHSHWAQSLGAGYLLGMLLSTTMLWLSEKLSGSFLFWLILGLWLALFFAALFWVKPWHHARPPRLSTPLWQKLLIGILLVLIALRLTSLGIENTHQAMPAWDAWVIWAERAKTWFYLGQLAPYVHSDVWLSAPQGSYESEAAHYPPLVSLIHLWAALALGRWDDALVNLPWLGAAIALGFTLYGALRSTHTPVWLAVSGAWLLLSLPILNSQVALAGYADLWLTLAYSQLILGLLLWIGTRQRAALPLILLGLISLPLIKHQVWLLLLASASPLLLWTMLTALPQKRRLISSSTIILGLVFVLGFNLADNQLHLPLLGEITWQSGQLSLPGLGYLAPDLQRIAEPMLFHLFILGSWHMLWGLAALAWLMLLLRLLRQKPLNPMLLALNLSLLSALAAFSLSFASPRVLPFIIDGTLLNRALLYLAPLLIFVIIHALTPCASRTTSCANTKE